MIAGTSGLDEIGLQETSVAFEIQGSEIKRKEINPQEFGFKKASLAAIQGGDAEMNASIINDILSGEKSARRDIVILNSAYALLVSGKVNDVEKGIKLAEKSIASGAAEKILQKLIKETRRYA